MLDSARQIGRPAGPAALQGEGKGKQRQAALGVSALAQLGAPRWSTELK